MHRVPAEAHPLTEGQASIWLADQLAAPSAAYHTTVALTVDGKFGRGDLERVARDLVDGTPALRIIMGPDASGSLRQWFSDTPVDVRWLAEPVEDPGGPGFTPPLRRMVTEPFRSDGGPLCRLVGADVAGGRRAVVLVAHHLINDGISQPQLARRFADLITGRAVPHEPVDRYLSLLATVRHAEQAASVDDASYWEHRLADHLNDPTKPLIDICQMPGGHVRMEFPDWVAERVTELAKEVGGTPFLVLLGAVHRTLAADGRERSVVAAAVSVRPAGGRYDDVVGCFTNVLPLVTVHRPQESLYDLLVREVPGWREDLRRRCVPVGDVVNRLKVASRRRDLYSVMVSIRTIPPVYRARGRTAVRADLMKRYYGAKADLAIRILRQGRSMFYDAEWRDGVPRDTAELMYARLVASLQGPRVHGTGNGGADRVDLMPEKTEGGCSGGDARQDHGGMAGRPRT